MTITYEQIVARPDAHIHDTHNAYFQYGEHARLLKFQRTRDSKPVIGITYHGPNHYDAHPLTDAFAARSGGFGFDLTPPQHPNKQIDLIDYVSDAVYFHAHPTATSHDSEVAEARRHMNITQRTTRLPVGEAWAAAYRHGVLAVARDGIMRTVLAHLYDAAQRGTLIVGPAGQFHFGDGLTFIDGDDLPDETQEAILTVNAEHDALMEPLAPVAAMLRERGHRWDSLGEPKVDMFGHVKYFLRGHLLTSSPA